MSKFKEGDRVVFKDASGVSLFYNNTGFNLVPILPGATGRVTCAYGGKVYVRFDGDTFNSQALLDYRFELFVPGVSIAKKIFYPCSHDYQELEDLIVLPCFQIGKVLITEE